jgi:hypothetical protein
MVYFKRLAAVLSVLFGAGTIAMGFWAVSDYLEVRSSADEVVAQCVEVTSDNASRLLACPEYLSGETETIGNREPSVTQVALRASWEIIDAEANQVLRSGLISVGGLLAVWGAFQLAFFWGSYSSKREQ